MISNYDQFYLIENGRKLCINNDILSNDSAECNRIYKEIVNLPAKEFAKRFINEVNSKFTLETIFNLENFHGFKFSQSFEMQRLIWKLDTFLQTARIVLPIVCDRLHNRLGFRHMRNQVSFILFLHFSLNLRDS